jgi:hypothetical protein
VERDDAQFTGTGSFQLEVGDAVPVGASLEMEAGLFDGAIASGTGASPWST